MRGPMDHPPRFPDFSVEWGNWGMPPPFGSFGGPEFHDGHRRPHFGPFGHGERTGPRFGHGDSTEHPHPGHQRRGQREERRGCCSSDSDEEELCCGARDFRRGPGGRFGFMHGPFGRHGPTVHDVRSWGGPWNGPCRGPWGPWDGSCRRPWGPGHPYHSAGRRGPCPCGHTEQGVCGRPGHRRSRKNDCVKCCENEPCCKGNKEKRGAKDNRPCNDKDRDGNTVFVQRIVLEKSARPQSV
uniref:SFRICE_023742 n=1 Tax=Spodoptera frugiperda TaxID=7108 RepID=A0A2H1VN47_SPOFR